MTGSGPITTATSMPTTIAPTTMIAITKTSTMNLLSSPIKNTGCMWIMTRD